MQYRNGLGIFYLIGAIGSTTANHGILKLLALNCPPGEVLFLRGLMMVGFLSIAVLAFSNLKDLRANFCWPVIVRGVSESVASVLFIVAVVHMPIADLYTVMSISPLIMTVTSVILYKANVGWHRWAAIFVGLLGSILVIRPLPGQLNWWAFFGLVIALAVVCRDLASSRIKAQSSAISASWFTSLILLLSSLTLGVGETWRPFSVSEFMLVTAAAAFLCIGIFLAVIAFRYGEVPVLAPFRYTTLLWGAAAGYSLFGEIPDAWALAGAALIFASGLYILHRESAVRRKAITLTQPLPE